MLRLRGSADERLDFVDSIVDLSRYKTCLCVGASAEQFQGKEYLEGKGLKLTVIEIYKPYVEGLKKAFPDMEVFLGDVRERREGWNNWWDIIFWWRGPEHLPKEDFTTAVKNLLLWGRHYIVVSVPWGEMGAKDTENKHDKHVSVWTDGDLEGFGFKCAYQGSVNKGRIVGVLSMG